MSVWTLTEAESFYSQWKTAYEALIGGKSYTINTGGTSRTLNRQDLQMVKDEMFYWKNYVEQLDKTNPNRGSRVKFITPTS